MEVPATVAPLNAGRSGSSTGGLSAGGARAGGRTPVGGFRSGSAQPNEAVQLLQVQVKELNSHLEGLEKERDFYFEKVRKMMIPRDLLLVLTLYCSFSASGY